MTETLRTGVPVPLELARNAANRHRAGIEALALLADLERAGHGERVEKPFYGWVVRSSDR
ncbi:hypothetical protein ABRP24_001265 [Curtobacterium sp. WHRI 8282]|uniref:hypothetical protein n=1 Tax=Curtobacterium sp. WHRI 8282 TaxID=3162559 RepID=UPI0032ED21D7